MGLSNFINNTYHSGSLHEEVRLLMLVNVKKKGNSSRLEAIFEAAIDGIVIIDTLGIIEMVNPAAATLFGYTSEELVGKNIKILIPRPDSQYHDEYLSKYLQTGKGKIIGIGREVEGLKKDGSTFPFRLSISEVIVGDEHLFTGIIHDLTKEKMAEAQLRHYASELERSNRDLQDFAYISSHDLQEPLRKIQAFGSRIQKKEGGLLSDQGQDYLQRMLNAAKRMRTLIDDLLNFSRVSTRANPFVETDLNELVWEVITDLELQINETKTEIFLSPLPVIEADPTQIRQVLQNLISNSLKFHRVGIKPTIHITSRQLHTAEEQVNPPERSTQKEMVEITIADNGIGFDQKYVDKIFQVFQRLEGRKYQGSGIGLAICKRIVTRHGGEITAKSKEGEGATFTLTLPLTQAGHSPGNDLGSF